MEVVAAGGGVDDGGVVEGGGAVEGGVGAGGVGAAGVVDVVVAVQDAGFVGPSGTPFEQADAIQIVESAAASPRKVACADVIG